MEMSEQIVINQLQGYKRIVARMKVLEKYSIGNGVLVSTLAEDDRLQELHRKLKGLPSYMYLSKREQAIETTAHAYLTKYPIGVKSQLREVRQLHGLDSDDEKLLRELEGKIQKVLDARQGNHDGFEFILDQISELQELQQQKSFIDNTLNALDEIKSGYGQLLRLRYVEERSVDEVTSQLNIVRRTYDRWRPKAMSEYKQILGVS